MYDARQQELMQKIQGIKKEKDVYIIAHYYQRPEVQDIADFVGDSYAMALAARDCDEDTILVAGVDFMAESAAILCPNKQILSPEPAATCPMAERVNIEDILAYREQYPDSIVVSYVNTSAEVKAVSDICCTSSNAMKIIKKISPQQKIYFIPDRNLGHHVAEQLNRQLDTYPSCCPTHQRVRARDIDDLKQKYPGTAVLAHPECSDEVRRRADFIGSTSAIINFAENSDNDTLIIVTEDGILHSISARCPSKTLLLASEELICPNMKSIDLEKILYSIENQETIITVPEEISLKARHALEEMIKWSNE